MRYLTPLLFALALASTPALAGEPTAPEAAAHEGGKEAEVRFTDDDNHDGTPNWRDATSEAYQVTKVGYHVLNLVIFLGVIVVFTRRPVLDALGNRAIDIQRSIVDAATARDAAKDKHAAIVARIDAFEGEVAKMRAEAEAGIAEEERRLVEKAEDEADRVALNAERNIRDEVTRARMALRADAVDLAVKLAEQTLKSQVQPDDQRRLARAFLASLAAQGTDNG